MFYQITKMKNTQSKTKTMKFGKWPGTTYCLECKDYNHNFKPQDKINQNSSSNKSKFLKQKHGNKK